MNLTQLPVKFEEAVSSVLKDITPGMKNSFCNILKELFSLTLEMPGRLNYTRLERMGSHTEKTYREAFSKEVDWAKIEVETIFRVFSADDSLSIVIDPSFLQKSGRCTPGAGLYWSGVAGAVRHGLEINAIGVSDVEKHDCMIVTAPVTPSPDVLEEQSVNLRSWYLITLGANKERLRKISRRVTADAYFATRDFVDGLKEMGFDIISRFRDNICLRYVHKADPAEPLRRGAKKKVDGKVDLSDPDMAVFREFRLRGDKGNFLTATLNSRALHRNVVAVIYYPQHGKPKIYFSTDLSLSGEQVVEFYRLRFHIEFCIRDAKQYTGLGESQSRKSRALDFAVNLSFAVLNMAKLVIHKEHLAISVGQFHLIMMVTALAFRFNSSRYADPPTSRKLATWNQALRKLTGIKAITA